jgi:hypothetical protein
VVTPDFIVLGNGQADFCHVRGGLLWHFGWPDHHGPDHRRVPPGPPIHGARMPLQRHHPQRGGGHDWQQGRKTAPNVYSSVCRDTTLYLLLICETMWKL